MACFILKPILWNTDTYRAPSGVRATDGFPKEWGFGHEEWNNSPRLELDEPTGRFRVFHTEGIGNAPVDENVGQTFVFMYASHDGLQQLVGVAGNAMWLGEPRHLAERQSLVKRLAIGDLWRDAWRLQRVRELHTEAQLRNHWKREQHWVANWLCPAEFYWWPGTPITLDSQRLRGTSKLLTMFKRHTMLDLSDAETVMSMVPAAQRDATWSRLVDAMRVAPTDAVTEAELEQTRGGVTTKLTMIQTRRGQAQFRDDVLERWGHACAVSGISRPEVLRASHIQPWASSKDHERRDPDNGLMLCANLDALFDRGLISFSDDGGMLISTALTAAQREELGLVGGALRASLNAKQRRFLDYHRRHCFKR